MEQLFENKWTSIAVQLCAVYGALKLTKGAFSLLRSLQRHYLRRPYNHFQRYAKDQQSWVLVTGGSDGAGYEICNQMAEQGFNICVVARNPDKISSKFAQLQAIYPKIDTRAVVFDFSKEMRIQDYQSKIADKVNDIDIAMVFLNAGTGQVGAFAEIDVEDVERIVSVNSLHPIYTAKVLLPHLLKRDHRSAIVVTSSGLGLFPVPGALTYSCSKTFASFLAMGLNYELKEKQIDCMAWWAGEMSTNMVKKPVGGRVLDTTTAVKGMLRDLGRETQTLGARKHALPTMVFGMMPGSFMQKIMFKAMCAAHKK